MRDFDDIRRRFPHLTLNVYAASRERVALEVMQDDETLGLFEGSTLASCLARAFPVEPEPDRPLVEGDLFS